jgi:hypothetical protein
MSHESEPRKARTVRHGGACAGSGGRRIESPEKLRDADRAGPSWRITGTPAVFQRVSLVSLSLSFAVCLSVDFSLSCLSLCLSVNLSISLDCHGVTVSVSLCLSLFLPPGTCRSRYVVRLLFVGHFFVPAGLVGKARGQTRQSFRAGAGPLHQVQLDTPPVGPRGITRTAKG